MKFSRTSVLLVVGCAFAIGCGEDGSDGGAQSGQTPGQGTSRGGPEALSGFTWGTTQSANGIDFDFSFEFGDTTLVATNVCSLGGEELTAEVEVPVTYRYRATVLESGSAGDEACNVAVAQGVIDFTISGNTMTAVSDGQTLTFTSSGARSGVYGDWTYSQDGLTLTWSVRGGTMTVKGDCGDKHVSTQVAATLQNFVDIVEAKNTEVGDESFNCSVGVDAGTAEYRFDGSTLVMSIDGQEIRFAPN